MKKFDRTLLVGELPTDLKSYWKLIFSKCRNHVFSEENIEQISDVLNKYANGNFNGVNFSAIVHSVLARDYIDVRYSWYQIDKYLPPPYRGSKLQDILNNESF